MGTQRHGVSVGLERSDGEFFLILKPVGKLTHADYEVITPLLDSALDGVRDAHVRALVDATEFDGWELRAAWDDFRLGLKHGNTFTRMAVVGDRKWQENMASLANWFMAGEVRFFSDADAALDWLKS